MYVREHIDKREATATSEIYTEDITKVSFIAVTVHYVNSKGKKVNLTLFCEAFEGCHSAEEIKAKLLEEFAALKIDPESVEKLTFITDNGSNVKLALSSYNRLHCMAHALNLVLKNSLKLLMSQVDVWGDIGLILNDCVEWLTTKKWEEK